MACYTMIHIWNEISITHILANISPYMYSCIHLGITQGKSTRKFILHSNDNSLRASVTCYEPLAVSMASNMWYIGPAFFVVVFSLYYVGALAFTLPVLRIGGR